MSARQWGESELGRSSPAPTRAIRVPLIKGGKGGRLEGLEGGAGEWRQAGATDRAEGTHRLSRRVCRSLPPSSKPNAAGEPELAIGGVVHVRIVSDPHEPAASVHVKARRPRVHLDVAFSRALFVHDVERESPLLEVAPEIEMRVGLPGA